MKIQPQKGLVIWLTGLSGAGKSTIAVALAEELTRRDYGNYILDGDCLRRGLCADLSFTRDARAENIRRAGEVAGLFADAGMVCIAAFVSPYLEDRARARKVVPEGRFIEVFVNAPIELCEKRDPKGLYRKARANLIPYFTGVSDPYEIPKSPEVEIRTGELTVEQSVALVMDCVTAKL